MEKIEPVDAWFFSSETKRLQYGDDRKIVVGETHSVQGPIELCQNGLHASIQLIDALKYATYPMLYRVRLHGQMKDAIDKIAAQHRTYLWSVDAERMTPILWDFSREQALKHVDRIKTLYTDGDYKDLLKWLEKGDPDYQDFAYLTTYELIRRFWRQKDSVTEFALRAVLASAKLCPVTAAHSAAFYAVQVTAWVESHLRGYDCDSALYTKLLHIEKAEASKILEKRVITEYKRENNHG